jgi:hypothetical protein
MGEVHAGQGDEFFVHITGVRISQRGGIGESISVTLTFLLTLHPPVQDFPMAKPNYSFAKRQREIAKKQKKDIKRQQKAETQQPPAQEDLPQSPVTAEKTDD